MPLFPWATNGALRLSLSKPKSKIFDTGWAHLRYGAVRYKQYHCYFKLNQKGLWHHHCNHNHHMNLAFSLADRITVLAQRMPLVEDVTDTIKGRPKVKEAYMSEKHYGSDRGLETSQLTPKPQPTIPCMVAFLLWRKLHRARGHFQCTRRWNPRSFWA